MKWTDKDKITKIIEKCFTGVYCDTCFYGLDSDVCEGCHRKYMHWAVSKEYAGNVANKIIEVLDGE